MIQIILSLLMMSLIHVIDYYRFGVWSHDLADGTTLGERNERYMNAYGNTSEILYKGECDLEHAVEMWKESPSHYEVISNPNNEYMVMMMVPDSSKEDRCFIVGTFFEEL